MNQPATHNSEFITLRPPVGRWDRAIQPGRYWRFWLGQKALVDVFQKERGVWMVRTEHGEDMELEMCAAAQFMRETCLPHLTPDISSCCAGGESGSEVAA